MVRWVKFAGARNIIRLTLDSVTRIAPGIFQKVLSCFSDIFSNKSGGSWLFFAATFGHAFPNRRIGFFLTEIVNSLWRIRWAWFRRFPSSFSIQSLRFFDIWFEEICFSFSLRNFGSKSLVMHSLFICQPLAQVGPFKPAISKKLFN